MHYVDTHCHLDLPHFDQDRDVVIARALDAGVEWFINPGIDIDSSKKILEMHRKYPQVLPAVGIHPNDITDDLSQSITELTSMLKNEDIRAIGEIGLDFYHKQVPPDLQEKALKMQLDLAAEHNLPVIIHSREALELITPILHDWSVRRVQPGHHIPLGVMHSFEGNYQQALSFIEMGFFISLAGPVTYKNAGLKHEIAGNIPLDCLLMETDAPYLTPAPFRGTRNEPAHLPQIGLRTAIIRMCDEAEVASATTQNASILFQLGVFH